MSVGTLLQTLRENRASDEVPDRCIAARTSSITCLKARRSLPEPDHFYSSYAASRKSRTARNTYRRRLAHGSQRGTGSRRKRKLTPQAIAIVASTSQAAAEAGGRFFEKPDLTPKLLFAAPISTTRGRRVGRARQLGFVINDRLGQ